MPCRLRRGWRWQAEVTATTLCDTEFMQSPLKAPSASTDPKSVKVNLTSGTGMEIEWRDGHRSSYSFPFLRDACPCALCEEERGKAGRAPGDPPKLAPGALPMFKAAAKPLSAGGVGKYAISLAGMTGTNWASTRGRFCGRYARARSARRSGLRWVNHRGTRETQSLRVPCDRRSLAQVFHRQSATGNRKLKRGSEDPCLF